MFRLAGIAMGLNYGYGAVRFGGAPLPVGARIRMSVRLVAVDLTADGAGATCTMLQRYERAGVDEPVCTAEFLLRVVG